MALVHLGGGLRLRTTRCRRQDRRVTETPDQPCEDEPAWYLAYRRYRYDGPVWRRYTRLPGSGQRLQAEFVRPSGGTKVGSIHGGLSRERYPGR